MALHRPRLAFTLVELVVVIAIIAILTGLALAASQRVRSAASRLVCSNKLRQIGLALHLHHDARRAFPAGITLEKTTNAARYVGWQFHLLPFIEQDALWRQSITAMANDPFPFHNPPHVALGTVVPLFLCSTDPRIHDSLVLKGHPTALTSFVGIVGIDRLNHNGILFPDSAVRIADVIDGTSQTIMVGERPPSASLLLGWWYAGVGQDSRGSAEMILGVRELRTSHPDVQGCPRTPNHFAVGQFDDRCSVLHFWSQHSGGAHFLFADGSVQFLNYSADAILPSLATRHGSESFDSP